MGEVRTTIITKRTCVRLALLIAAGAIVNVAVAWGCASAVSSTNPFVRYVADPSNEQQRPVTIIESNGYAQVQGVDRTQYLQDPLDVIEYTGDVWWTPESIRPMTNNYAIACGWPAYAMTAWRTVLNNDEMLFPGVIHHGMLTESFVNKRPVGNAEDVPTVLAFLPLWPGFAVNTVFYAVVLWPLFAASSAVRRRLRVKRGVCWKCEYDLRGHRATSEVCPECGAAVSRTTKAAMRT